MHVLVGRIGELGIVDRFLADALREPRTLLIEGEPGIGKTTLLHEVLALAGERDCAVLYCRPTRSEMDLSYIGLVELLGCMDDEVIDALPDPQARVLRMMLRRDEPEGALDRLSLGVAVVAAVRAVAATRPMLIAVDDAQWLDPPSARVVAFLARRLAGTAARIAMVRSKGDWSPGLESDLSQHPLSDEVVDWRTELSRAMPEGRLDTIKLGPIGASELSRILRRVLGWVPAWPRVVRIAELSEGNPLHALELTRAFGGMRSGEILEYVSPDGVLELARSRIAKLPGNVRDAVELASISRAAKIDMLCRIDPRVPDLRDALEIARRSGIVTIDDDQIRFAHPILAAAVYGSIPAHRKRELHRSAAGLSDDPEERARHMATAAAGPDARVAAALEEAAQLAWRRGAPDAAADLLHLACQLTPATDDDALTLRRTAFGRLLHSAGDGSSAVAELEGLVASLPHGSARARALYHLAYITRLSGSLGRAVDHGVQAAADAMGDPLLQAEIYELLSRISDGDIEGKLDAARKGLEAIGRVLDPDPDVVFHVRAALVEAEFCAGLGTHLERLSGLDPGTAARFPPVRTASGGEDLIGRLLMYDGRIEEGLAILRGLYERASVESRSILPAVLGWMAEAHIIAGRFAAAAELTREAITHAEETGGNGGTPWEVGFHAVALALLGKLDEAEAVAAQVIEMAETDPAVGLDEAPARLALGITALARARFNDAVIHLRYLDRLKQRAGIREPRVCAHVSDLIEALLGAGELQEAAEALARFEEEAVASGSRWSLAAAARSRALLLGASGRMDEALEAAQRSLALFEDLPMRFERSRTVFALGQIRRRRKEKQLAREALNEALTTFENLQTPVWADRARAELARIPQQRGSEGLSPTEATIARLAAEGLTNREIADRTFLSPKTVEVNLTRIYRKLGVRSRAVLAGRFAVDQDRRRL